MEENTHSIKWTITVPKENILETRASDTLTSISGKSPLTIEFRSFALGGIYDIMVIDYHPQSSNQYTLGPSKITPTEMCAGQIRLRSPVQLNVRPIVEPWSYPENHVRRQIPAGAGLLSSIGPILPWCYELLPGFHYNNCEHEYPDLSKATG